MYSQPCEQHIELRVKTERELAIMGQALEFQVKGLGDARATISDCIEDMQQAVDLLGCGKEQLARQDERLKAGNGRFNVHLAMIIGLYLCVFSIGGFVIATHGPKALAFLRLPGV